MKRLAKVSLKPWYLIISMQIITINSFVHFCHHIFRLWGNCSSNRKRMALYHEHIQWHPLDKIGGMSLMFEASLRLVCFVGFTHLSIVIKYGHGQLLFFLSLSLMWNIMSYPVPAVSKHVWYWMSLAEKWRIHLICLQLHIFPPRWLSVYLHA